MKVQAVEGRWFIQESEKKSRRIVKDEGASFGTGRFARQVVKEDAQEIQVSSGRTISLGNFEFARVGISVSAKFEEDNIEEGFETLQSIVVEMLEREESKITGRDVPENALPEIVTGKLEVPERNGAP